MRIHATAPAVVNGLNSTLLDGLLDRLRERPEGGRIHFRSRTEWQHGARSITHFTGFEIDGAPHHQNRPSFVTVSDEPLELSGTDVAPSPMEQLMGALGSCIVYTANANAALMGVEVTRIEVEVESDMDLHGSLGLDPSTRPGLGALRVTLTLAGDADELTLREVALAAYNASPVRDSVEQGVGMTATVVTVGYVPAHEPRGPDLPGQGGDP